jgi:NAD(P)-dependent dehydrogenase (short-subunit alcohol dehydrogenase family)
VQRFQKLDAALLNCCHRGESKSIFDVTEDDFDRIMTINAKSGMSFLPAPIFANMTR